MNRRTFFAIAACLLGAAVATPATAKVSENTAGGFTVSHSVAVAAAPPAVWAQMIHPERWWNKAHSWSGNAANLFLKLEPGGCFCEMLPQNGFAEHARVIQAVPEKMLRLSGALGPLQGEAVVGTLTMTIKPGESAGSIIEFDYVVAGSARYDLKGVAAAVDKVIGEQHRRLGELLANGKLD